jgi:aldehyde dehydrogenase (NAD+)
MWIDGRECLAADGATFEVFNPQTGAAMGVVPRASKADADAAVESARRAAVGWAKLVPAERERIMLRIADTIEAHEAELLALVIDESGSTLQKARYEVLYSASLFRAAAGEARRLYGDTFPNDKNHRLSLVLRQPLGVVLAISPFNAPLVLLVKMIVFALAAGNAVIAKPSEETPLVALALARIASEAGMPPGVLNVVTGYGTEIGMALVEHPQIQGIAFTGSTSTGVRIGQAAMPTMKRLQLELGGKNPLIVLRDIDIEEAAHIAAIGAYYHAGQICMSGSRLIVERSIVEPFTAALVRRAQNLRLGDLRDLTTAYGPLINERALHKVQSHVDAALQAGGELVCGGTVKSGLTYNATVLYDVPMDCIAWREETFGPVASVVAVDDLEHALAIANDSVYGLSAGILTNDIKKGFEAARSLNAGAVHVGMHPFQSDAMAPVGGFGMSGMGRSGGKYSVEHFTELKWISVELGDVPKPF